MNMKRKIDGIIFTGMSDINSIARPAGAVRVRTWLSQNNYDIEIIDYLIHFSELELEILCKNFIKPETIFVGISLTFLVWEGAFNNVNILLKHIKENYPHVKTIFGGSESDLSNLYMKYVDNIIWGYAEDAILHYLDFLTGKRSDNLNWIPYKESLLIDAEADYKSDSSDLTIKWLKDDLLETNYLPIEISRGCIFRCKFCQYPLLGKKKTDYIRYENNLAEEFRYNWEQWGITNYSFQDDTFNDNIVKLEKVANAIAKSGINITYSAFLRADLLAALPETIPMLIETGIIAANFGIESLNIETKKIIGKGHDNEKQFEAIRNLKKQKNIYTFTGMIVGLPRETIESVENSQQWFFEQNREVFNMWQWWPLGIRAHSITRKSEFDKNYIKYGYNILESEKFFSLWKNKYMDCFIAGDLAKKFNQEIKEKLRDDNSIISHWHQRGTTGMFEPAELVGLGFTIEEILNDKIDHNLFNSVTKKLKNSIQNYKILKLQTIKK